MYKYDYRYLKHDRSSGLDLHDGQANHVRNSKTLTMFMQPVLSIHRMTPPPLPPLQKNKQTNKTKQNKTKQKQSKNKNKTTTKNTNHNNKKQKTKNKPNSFFL